MFPLHETNRRLLCRVIFLMLVPLPTLAVVAWCGATHLPAYTAAYEDRLSAALGVRVQLDAVSHPLPGKTVLHGVELIDTEQGAVIAECDELTVTHVGGTLLITAEQAILKRDQFDRGWEALQARLRRPDMLPAKTRLVVRRLRVDVNAGYETLERVDLTIQSGRSGMQSSLAFGLFGAASDEPVRLDIVRNRQSTPPATRIEMRTGPTALPCSLLSLTDEGLSALGPQSRFQGVVRMQQTHDGWTCQLTGYCSAIDLDRLVTQQFPPHVLGGTANLLIESVDPNEWGAELKNGRLVRAEGVIVVEKVRVGAPLMRVLAQQFPALPTPSERLTVEFKIDADGLSILRYEALDDAGAVIVAGDGPLRGVPIGPGPQSLTGLLRGLLPQDEPSAARAYLEAVLPRAALLR